MDNSTEVSLQDILSALGGPLEEKSLWALLNKSCSLLEQELRDHKQHASDPDLLITPETVWLYRGGAVQFLRGIADSKSTFRAPELVVDKTHQLNKIELEKSYIYSLGMTLFTAMQNGLDDDQAPRVSDDINNVLVAMVADSAEERISLSGIESLCRKRTTNETSTAEVDKLVSYILGTQAELSLSDCGDAADLDDANLEAEFQEAMNIPPTGSVEHLYSPSYGSRASSSLSIHSAAGNLQRHASFKSQDSGSADIQLQYSSMPMVYFSSQDRLNKPPGSRRGTGSDNDSWSSFDRLTTPLQPHELNILASKAKVGGGITQLPPPPHTRYVSHLYTPTRVRKPARADVNRSASFEHRSLGIYRSSSDGTHTHGKPPSNETLAMKVRNRNEGRCVVIKSEAEANKPSQVEGLQPGVNTFSLDDMPALPPNVTADKSTESPRKIDHVGDTPPGVPSSVEKIDSILQSVERRKSEEGIEDAPPPLPADEPPLFTPQKSDGSEQHHPPDTPRTNTTFDYSELGSPPQSPLETSAIEDEEFEFASPPPIPFSSPPQDNNGGDSVLEVMTVAEVQPLENAQPIGLAWKANEKDFDRTITPRRALDEAFKELDKIGESGLLDTSSELGADDQTINNVDLDALYAKVDMSKKTRKSGDSNEQVQVVSEASPIESSTSTGDRITEDSDVDALYAKVNMNKKGRNRQNAVDGEEDARRHVQPEANKPNTVESAQLITPKAVNNDTPFDLGYEQVEFKSNGNMQSKPQRISTAEDPGYAKIGDVVPHPSSEDYSEVHTTVTLAPRADSVRKASSESNMTEIDLAVVHHPKRASMPPGSVPGGDSDYELVGPAIPKRAFTVPVPANSNTLSPMTAGADVEKSRASMKKLQVVFGPEFTKLNDGQPQLVEPKSPVARSSPVSSLPEGRRVVKVILLNAKSVQFVVERESKCNELFQQVVSHQSLQEKRIFGLAVIRDRDEIFLDLERKLSKYAPSGWTTTPAPPPGSRGSQAPVFTVFFRVQYYVENVVTDLRLAQTRHQLYLQLRKDILEGKMFCHEHSALKLAAYALQAEKGDYSPQLKDQAYFRLEDYLPIRAIDKLGRSKAESLLPDIHNEQQGKNREEAEMTYLKEAQTLPEYGVVFYRVSRDKQSPLGSTWLGFCIRGIVVYDIHKDVKTPITHCPWNSTQNISFSNRKFIVEQQDSKPFVFFTQSYRRARYLLHLSISYHRFQLVSRGLLPLSPNPDGSPIQPIKPLTPGPIEPIRRNTKGSTKKNRGYDLLVKHSVKVIDSLSREYKTLADILFSKGFISHELVQRIDQIPATDVDHARKLYTAVLATVEHYPYRYADFVSILKDNAVLYGDLLGVLGESYTRKAIHDDAPGSGDHTPKSGDPHVRVVKILKETGKGLGIRIADSQSPEGIDCVVIERIEKDGPVYMDGKLKKGDVLLSVGDRQLAGLSHKQVGDILKKSSEVVKFTIRRSPNPDLLVPLSPPHDITTESVVVEIEDDHSPLMSKRQLKRATTLEIASIINAERLPDPPSPHTSDSVEYLDVTVTRGTNRSFGFAIATGEFDGVVVLKVTPGGQAEKSHLQSADRIIAINNVDIEHKTYNEVLGLIQQSNSKLKLNISRRGPSAWPDIENLPPGTSFVVELEKQRGSLGLRIAGGKEKPYGFGFIYVKDIVEGSTADLNKVEKNDILMKVNNDKMAGITHREAANVIVNSREKVRLHIHRPHDRLWLEPSRDAYLKSDHRGLKRDESSSSLYVHSRPLSQIGASLDLSSIDEGQESLHAVSDMKTTDLNEPEVSVDIPETIIEVIPPELPADGPPLDDSLFKDEPSLSIPLIPGYDLLSSTSEPHLLSASNTLEAEGLSEVKSESFLLNTSMGTVNEEDGRILVSLRKGFRGLGFSLDKTLSGQPGRGVFVLSVDYDPAKSDGRIQPGDEITQVNDDSIVDLSHKEAFSVLGLAQGLVSLVIRRDQGEQEEEQKPPPIPPLSHLPVDDSDVVPLIVPVTAQQDETTEDMAASQIEEYAENKGLLTEHEPVELNLELSTELPNQEPATEEQEPGPPLSPLPDDDDRSPYVSDDEGRQDPTIPPSPLPTMDELPQDNLPSTPSVTDDDEEPPPIATSTPSDTDDEAIPSPLPPTSPLPDELSADETSQLMAGSHSSMEEHSDGSTLAHSDDDEDVSDFEEISLPSMPPEEDDRDQKDRSSSDDLQPGHFDSAPPLPYTPPPLDMFDTDLTASEELLSRTPI